MPKYKCYFKPEWLDNTIYSNWTWLRTVPGDRHRAFCTVCNKSFDIQNMGKAAIISHEKRPAHISCLKAASSTKINHFLKPSVPHPTVSSVITTSSSMHADVSPSDLSTLPSNEMSTINTELRTAPISAATKIEVIKAEVIWALDSVKKHRSLRSCDDQTSIFQAMFKNNPIVENFQMAKDKLGYVVTFGLSPHFQKEILTRVHQSKEFSISFDEALNKIVQRGQQDLWIRYFNESTGLVVCEYVTSVFLGHSKAENIYESVNEALDKIGGSFVIDRLFQISMDGPAVNLSFLRRFSEEFERMCGKELLQTGVCSLHVVSGALQNGLKKVFGIYQQCSKVCTTYLKILLHAGLITPTSQAPQSFPKLFVSAVG